jgi:hypothetical protein
VILDCELRRHGIQDSVSAGWRVRVGDEFRLDGCPSRHEGDGRGVQVPMDNLLSRGARALGTFEKVAMRSEMVA